MEVEKTEIPADIIPNVYLISLLAGGIAGLVVDVSLFPVDAVKTRLQSEGGFWRAGKSIKSKIIF
jgi:hypothetical protein